MPRGTDAPVILRGDPRLQKRKKSGWGSVDDAFSVRGGIKEGESDPTYPRLSGRTLFALRGFGCFDIAWGIGAYGKTFTELIRHNVSDNADELRLNHTKCKITNRIDVGFSTLQMGTDELRYGGEENLILGDFAHVSTSAIGSIPSPKAKRRRNLNNLQRSKPLDVASEIKLTFGVSFPANNIEAREKLF